MQIGQNLKAILGNINDDRTITDYKTRPESVQRLKSFEQTIKAMNDAKDVITSTRLEMEQFDLDVDRHRGRMLERIENAERKISTMQAHINDIIDEASPGSYVHWNAIPAPDQLDDVVFTPPELPKDEE